MKTKHILVFVALFTYILLVSNYSYAQVYRKGVVASATPEATEAGFIILKKGGNAVDASIAVSFTLGVTEPAMSGLGGRSMMIVSKQGEPPIAIGRITLTPSNVKADILKENLTYYKQVSIPSQLKVLHYTWKKYGSGTIKWEELLEPAIHYAEKGFEVGEHRHYVYKRGEKKLKGSNFHNGEILINGEIPAIGDIIKQPTLAKTLRRIAKHGADDFYKGEIAKVIAKDMSQNGGWITYEDLKNFPKAKEYKPIQVNYKGYNVYSFVPPSGGWGVLQALNVFKNVDENTIKNNSFERTMQLAKVLNLVHNDRRDNPLMNFENYEEELKHKLSNEYAVNLLNSVQKNNSIKEEENNQGETTHLSVVDKNGMAVSMTSSVGGYFGSVTSTKSLGFFYNSYVKSLMSFGFGEPKPISSYKPIPSSMSPSLVKKDGKNALIIGTPGSKRIVSTISQLIQLWVDSGESITKLIKLPRVHAINDEVYIENLNLTSMQLNEIRSKGYKIVFPSYDLTKNGLNAYFGGVHAIEFKDNTWNGAADPRRDGSVSN